MCQFEQGFKTYGFVAAKLTVVNKGKSNTWELIAPKKRTFGPFCLYYIFLIPFEKRSVSVSFFSILLFQLLH